MTRYLFSMAFILTLSSPLYSFHLKWDIPLRERLEIVRTATVEHLRDNALFRVYEERNIIDLTCIEEVYENKKVAGEFSVYRREQGETVFRLQEQYNSEFIIEPNGRYQIEDKYYMPNLRHMPTFPDDDIIVGSKWNATGEILIREFSRPFKLLFPVSYTFFDVQVKDGVRIAQIHYEYMINKDLIDQKYPPDFPVKIVGKSLGVIYWDIQNNRPLDIKDRYRIIFLFRSGARSVTSYELKMNIETSLKMYTPLSPKLEEKDREEIARDLKKDRGMSVEKDRRGLAFRMGDVLFDFDSFGLRDDTQKTLDKLIDILKKKYPDREIIVEGHTDTTGARDYNQKLSEKRAKSVAEYLKKGMGHDKMSYRGYGPEKPIGDNSTKQGREKNRRVEIIIKLK